MSCNEPVSADAFEVRNMAGLCSKCVVASCLKRPEVGRPRLQGNMHKHGGVCSNAPDCSDAAANHGCMTGLCRKVKGSSACAQDMWCGLTALAEVSHAPVTQNQQNAGAQSLRDNKKRKENENKEKEKINFKRRNGDSDEGCCRITLVMKSSCFAESRSKACCRSSASRMRTAAIAS